MRPNVPSLPIQNGIHPMTVNNLPMGYPVHQYPPMPATGHHHLDSVGCGASSGHVVNGVPAPGSFHPVHATAENNGTSEPVPAAPPCSAMSSVSEMAVSPTSVASSNHFPFTPSEISGMGMDAAALDTNFALDAADTQGLQLGQDGGVGSSGSLGQIWNFSLSDLTTDFANFGDIGDLGDYTSSPFLPSDSDRLFDSPEQDDLVEEYFADTITGAFSQSDEEKS